MAAPMDRGRARPYFRAAMSIQDENRLATQTFTAWADAFTPAELDAIEAYGDSLAPEQAVVLAETVEGERQAKIRITQTAWLPQNPDTKWIYDRVQAVIRSLNDASYKYDLRGFSENFQYTVYRDSEGGHYDWHVDQGPLAVQRKLSVSVQLSHGHDYEGCDLQFVGGNKTETGPRERGTVIAFPSYVLHRVTPIVSGTRKALVVWTTGPNFR
jgi:PKHD-type hydroxylase